MKECFTNLCGKTVQLFDRALNGDSQQETQDLAPTYRYTLSFDPQAALIPMLLPAAQKRFHTRRRKHRYRGHHLDVCCHGVMGGCKRVS